jgi:hypothetical protein
MSNLSDIYKLLKRKPTKGRLRFFVKDNTISVCKESAKEVRREFWRKQNEKDNK